MVHPLSKMQQCISSLNLLSKVFSKVSIKLALIKNVNGRKDVTKVLILISYLSPLQKEFYCYRCTPYILGSEGVNLLTYNFQKSARYNEHFFFGLNVRM